MAALALLLVAALAAAAFLVVGGGGEDRKLVPAGPGGDRRVDPLAYDPDREADLVRRASTGLGDVLWEKSPGGVPASARRTARWRPLVEKAAAANGTDPDLLEAIVLLESAGDPDARAGDDVESASGLAQILSGTAVDLLGMHVDVEASRRLTARIRRAAAAGNARRVDRLRRARRRVDDRFDPPKALAGAARYLALARKRFGRDDFAVASYHMGIGNLESVLRDFGGAQSYTELYFDSTPLRHAQAYRRLSSLGDDSATYLWRVLAARDVMRLHRTNPAELERLWELEQRGGAALRRLHPGGAPAGGEVSPPSPEDASRVGLDLSPLAGTNARLRPEALSTLLYLGTGVRAVTQRGPLVVAGAGGWTFDIERRYANRRHALGFEFMLDRLQALNLIAWSRGGAEIHVVVGRDAGKLLPAPKRLLEDALR